MLRNKLSENVVFIASKLRFHDVNTAFSLRQNYVFKLQVRYNRAGSSNRRLLFEPLIKI